MTKRRATGLLLALMLKSRANTELLRGPQAAASGIRQAFISMYRASLPACADYATQVGNRPSLPDTGVPNHCPLTRPALMPYTCLPNQADLVDVLYRLARNGHTDLHTSLLAIPGSPVAEANSSPAIVKFESLMSKPREVHDCPLMPTADAHCAVLHPQQYLAFPVDIDSLSFSLLQGLDLGQEIRQVLLEYNKALKQHAT